MANAAIDKEILVLEREYWDSMITKDPGVATRLTGDESVIVGAQGVSTVSSQSIGKMVQSDAWKLTKYEFSDVTVVAPSEDIAVIGYHVKEELEIDGKPLTFEANDATTWIRKGGRWVSVLHSESLSGDPFGRDKRST